MKKSVTVKGAAPDLWQTLLSCLNAHGYVVQTQSPYTTLTANRGSKLSSLILESTKDGYRDLYVTFVPRGGNSFEVQFEWKFPAWTITWEGARKDCRDMADEFAARAGQVGGPAAASTMACPACGASVTAGARFCYACGAATSAPAPPPAASQPTCPACGAKVSATARFCDSCGATLAGKG